MTAPRLIADIGGTNSRLALSDQGEILPGSAQRFRNDRHADFAEILHRYCARLDTAPADAVIAAAGPAADGAITLTNRDWTVSSTSLKALFGFRHVVLLNDLAAMGHALPAIADDIQRVFEAPAQGTQQLVVGMGTGFNVCAIGRDGQGGRVPLQAEMGHCALPGDILAALNGAFGAGATPAIEDVFSGRGLLRVANALFDTDLHDSRAAIGWLAGRPAASARFAELYGTCLGRLVRFLTLAFLPRGGIFFAGSVARAVLTGPSAEHAFAQCRRPYPLAAVKTPPIGLIEADMAALKGCARLPVPAQGCHEAEPPRATPR